MTVQARRARTRRPEPLSRWDHDASRLLAMLEDNPTCALTIDDMRERGIAARSCPQVGILRALGYLIPECWRARRSYRQRGRKGAQSSNAFESHTQFSYIRVVTFSLAASSYVRVHRRVLSSALVRERDGPFDDPQIPRKTGAAFSPQ